MVQVRFEVDEYTTRVLDVIKGKFGLKNRSEALNKFAIEKGTEFLEPKPNEKVLKEIDEIYKTHIKKYCYKSMTEKELDKLLDIEDV